MPTLALAALDVTLDAATSVVEARLAPRGGPHAQRGAVQRACLVLCATAWESYAKDNIMWLAEVAAEHCPGPEQLTPRLRTLVDEAPASLRTAITKARKVPETNDPRRAEKLAARERYVAEDNALLERLRDGEVAWPELLELELRRRVLGVRTLTGSVIGGMRNAMYWTVGDLQLQTYGQDLIREVRVPPHRPDYIGWIDTLVEVRNSGVHRGTTPGPLDTTGVRSWIGFVRDVAHDLDRRAEDWAEEKLSPEKTIT